MGYQTAPLVMEAHVGIRRTLGIVGAASAVLALGAAPAPFAHAAPGNRVSEEYLIHQSGNLSWSVTIIDRSQTLTQAQCEELNTNAQTVFSTSKTVRTSFTQSSGSNSSNTCSASLRVPLDKNPLMQTDGKKNTLTLRTAVTDTVMTALGVTTRDVEATVFDATIVDSSSGAEIDHDSGGYGWETAKWENTNGDLTITYDGTSGTSGGRASSSSTPTLNTLPSPSNNAAGQKLPGDSDNNSMTLIIAAVVVGVIVIAAAAVAVIVIIRSRRGHVGPSGYAAVPYPNGQRTGGLPGQEYGQSPGYGQPLGSAGQPFPFGAGAVPQTPPGPSASAQTGLSVGGPASAPGLPPVPMPPKQRSRFAPEEDS